MYLLRKANLNVVLMLIVKSHINFTSKVMVIYPIPHNYLQGLSCLGMIKKDNRNDGLYYTIPHIYSIV